FVRGDNLRLAAGIRRLSAERVANPDWPGRQCSLPALRASYVPPVLSSIPGACQHPRPAVQRGRECPGDHSKWTSRAVRSRRRCAAAEPSPEFHRGRNYFSTVISQSEFVPLRFPKVVSVFSKPTWANLAKYTGTSSAARKCWVLCSSLVSAMVS